jgi:DNA-binding MarR family transcriptional regulator
MSESVWLDPEELRVYRAFSRATRGLFVRFDQELQEKVGMPRTYFEILWLLHEAPDHAMRMSELAGRTGSQPSRISHAIRRLEIDGLVTRELCADDHRGWFTVLTDDGIVAVEAACGPYAQSIRRHFLEPLSPTQQRQLTRVGELLLERLNKSLTEVLPATHADVTTDAKTKSATSRAIQTLQKNRAN